MVAVSHGNDIASAALHHTLAFVAMTGPQISVVNVCYTPKPDHCSTGSLTTTLLPT